MAVAITVIIIAIFLNWVLRILGSHKSLMSREAAHLRRWTRREIKLLDDQARLLVTIRKEQDVKDKALETIKRMEQIILRYEKAAMANRSSHPKKTKLSAKPDTYLDLFDGPAAENGDKKRSRVMTKAIKFVPKF